MPLIRLLPVLIVLLPFAAGAEQIHLDIFPSPAQIRPIVHTARFVVSLRIAESDTERTVRFKVRLTAPGPRRLFSTDFPQVEGKRLLDLEVTSQNGKVEWEYVFPIRGNYRLEVEAILGSGDPIKESFEIPVKEREQKYLYLGIILALLFLFGFAAGRIFSSEQ